MGEGTARKCKDDRRNDQRTRTFLCLGTRGYGGEDLSNRLEGDAIMRLRYRRAGRFSVFEIVII